jgi:hypothetical protein
MKPRLLYPDRDLDLDAEAPANADDLTRDLGLDTLFGAMADGDEFLYRTCEHTVLATVDDPDVIVYRQRVLRDCLAHPEPAREIYDIAVEAIKGEKTIYRGIFFDRYPEPTLHRSIEALEFFVGILKRLRQMAEHHLGYFESDGLRTLLRQLVRELDDAYLDEIGEHLRRLRFRKGVLISAELGKGHKGRNYVLRKPNDRGPGWLNALTGKSPESYSFRIADRDEAGSRALAELRGRGIDLAANSLARSADHITSYFTLLRGELGFYMGCLNLHAALAAKGRPTCFPVPTPSAPAALRFRDLYDLNLGLRLDNEVVGNDADATDRSLIMITGANQGGKSTFLRSVGLAQLLMQAGMFTPATSYTANVASGLYTHYRREEDATMNSGKFDEELNRMSQIAEEIRPHAMVLFNESFAATNEREGSEIARQIIRALRERDIKVVFVTHLYDLAHSLHRNGDDSTALFLRAERESDGRRTFRLVTGEPLPTSYGPDLYHRIFGSPERATVGSRGRHTG